MSMLFSFAVSTILTRYVVSLILPWNENGVVYEAVLTSFGCHRKEHPGHIKEWAACRRQTNSSMLIVFRQRPKESPSLKILNQKINK